MKTRWFSAALADRRSQLRWLAERNRDAAIVAGDRIVRSMQMLTHSPRMGRPGRIDGTRELTIRRTNFVIAYRIDADGIVVLRLLHMKQQWPSTF